MTITTCGARITGPVSYLAGEGMLRDIPLGPCLVERGTDSLVAIIWGTNGQNSAALPVNAIARAEERGYLVLLD
jgi:hypothetical protein